MSEDIKQTLFLHNERVQITLRFILVAIVTTNFYYLNLHYMTFPLLVAILNALYLYITLKHPYTFQKERLIFFMLLDIFVSVYVMYLVGEVAVYYNVILLWFIVGYGMRYGVKMGSIAFVAVVFAWLVLISTSEYWLAHQNYAIGLLLSYIILPMYYCFLVKHLHKDISKLHSSIENSHYQAQHDPLTNLPNRLAFEEDLLSFISAAREEKKHFALFFIDLDQFKEVNDTFGHDVGDKVLQESAKRIKRITPQSYRLGGDEFVALVEYADEVSLRRNAEELISSFCTECKIVDITLSASVGISLYSEDAQNAFDLKKHADIAMYLAKKLGKNRFCFYGECEEYL